MPQDLHDALPAPAQSVTAQAHDVEGAITAVA